MGRPGFHQLQAWRVQRTLPSSWWHMLVQTRADLCTLSLEILWKGLARMERWRPSRRRKRKRLQTVRRQRWRSLSEPA